MYVIKTTEENTLFYEQEKDKAQEKSQIAEDNLNRAREHLKITEEGCNIENINLAHTALTNAENNFSELNKLFQEAIQNYIKQLDKEMEEVNSW